MTMTLKKPRKMEKKEVIEVAWPIRGWTFSHIGNIGYAISLLERSAVTVNNPVIGYYLVRGWGTRDMYHRVLTKEEAEKLSKKNKSFEYETLEDLLQRQREIKEGKYKIEDGLIVGLNPNYPRK